MSLITTAVKFTVLPADGVPVAGLRVRCELTRPDVDGGVLVPMPRARGDTDANGQCTIHLWPNSRGVNASQYRVKVYQGTELIHSFLITVPEQAGVVLAETIINQAPYPAVDAAQAAVTAAQAAAAQAAGSAHQAATACDQVGLYAIEVAFNAAAAAQSAIDAGDASRLEAGAVTTLDPGEDATAEITGAPGAQVLVLGIPKGDKGDIGPSGAGERRHAFAAPYSYAGVAIAGTADSASGWAITRITVAADGTTTVGTATGAWTDRASLIYA